MLPQVLVGLGLFSFLSASCLLWLQRLQPLFLTVALGTLAHEAWLVRRQLPGLRTVRVKAIFAGSLVMNLMILMAWVFLSYRYQ